ncbi:MAG: hypothetical protein ACXVB9_07160 [Bdellovibrionota bacterium]
MENAAEPGKKAKRSVRGFLVRPRQQLRSALLIVAVCIFFELFMLVGFQSSLNSTFSQIAQTHPEIAAQLSDSTVSIFRMMIAYVALLGASVLVVGIVLNHRVYGSLVPILRHVSSLKEQNFSSRVHLRATDELQELAGELNQLAETLEKRNS